MKEIPIAKPLINWREQLAVMRVLKSGSLTQGPEVKLFEEEFSKIVGDRECVAVNSGTSALHVSLLALGIGSGDEVILPSFTFAATANVVALAGATPVFVDIDPKTFCINADLIQSAISKKTKAIIVVHIYGLAAEMTKILEIAKINSLLVVEDAAQAHLASIDNKNVGTFGDAAAFSFYPTKNMTSGEGGMVVLKNSKDARICRLLRNQGMESKYQNEVIGFNLRMTDIHAAIGRCQLRKLSEATEKRIKNAQYLSQKLNSEFIPYVPTGFKHVFHQYTVRIKDNRNDFSVALQNLGIGNSVYYPTQVHKLPSFDLDLILRETELATNEVLSLPVHPSLTKMQLNRICNSFNKLGSSMIK
jgi:dTDP-4-amino-4,6-dideoxygalactose transaminase